MVQFTDASTGSPTTWSWDFGDGESSSLQNPSHTFTDGGTYTVTLTATNAEGCSVATKSDFISVNAAQPATPTPQFTDAPTYEITAKTTADSSEQAWLDKENAKITPVSATATARSPGYDMLSALVGCGIIAGIAVCRKH
jgi:PKD repeat protein